MTEMPFATTGRIPLAPELRFNDVRIYLKRGRAPFDHRIDEPERAVFVFVRKGDLVLTLEHSTVPPISMPTGATVGFEGGRAHRWTSGSMQPGDEVELFYGSIPKQMAVLQRMAEGLIVVPPNARPYAQILTQAVELSLCEQEARATMPDADDFIMRRCAEICAMQLIEYARARAASVMSMPVGVRHDVQLLQALSAYFADPRRHWTVASLASAAGLSRSAFASRFRKAYDSPPLQTLTALRLEQAVTLLRHSKSPLIEIAFIAGYNSEAAFVRAFHRKYGTPPGRFRAEYLHKNATG